MKRLTRWAGLAMAVLLLSGALQAQAEAVSPDASINAWLMRLHEASRKRAYTGTFVVSAGGNMASAKIWHVCDGTQQMERVESLSGPPRSTFRRNDQVVTFYPQNRIAVAESRDSLGLFPNLLKSSDSTIAEFYKLKVLPQERIAGFDADVVQLVPKDNVRFGYRVWSEKKSGLVMQLQTLDLDGKVLEQAAFSELQLDAPVSMGKLSQMMANTDGYRVEHSDLQKTTADAQGWVMRTLVAGFKPMGCYKRPVAALAGASGHAAGNAMQWMFSDGLATVSLFVEAYDSQRHVREGATDMGGATHTLTRRFNAWWITAVGEVPPATLSIFARGLERKK
ncbi:MucB/RseB C-terminal domain-containing protein [Rhodoferax saidenbachensis]|uniref:Transcriptional regulator n=1 Tax=Rhodoferax saidenbachensis TaxID=1484693 RepID=A0A1P8KCH2_9BURK|nr:MucB/RseB C-terminal domain-containing protein [Rhodoferax saidenbachensis]APW43638.1 transcriptional regulator [Rhodoferax saidenbachensis]